MNKNKFIPDFGVLNRFFDEDIEPEDFLNDLTDIIEEYSRLAITNENQILPNETAIRIHILGTLHREIRKYLK